MARFQGADVVDFHKANSIGQWRQKPPGQRGVTESYRQLQTRRLHSGTNARNRQPHPAATQDTPVCHWLCQCTATVKVHFVSGKLFPDSIGQSKCHTQQTPVRRRRPKMPHVDA